MPRTAQEQHFYRYRYLRAFWLFAPTIYSVLPPMQQLEVHRLYRPSQVFTEETLPAQIKAAIAAEPSLVNRVGKHWRLLYATYEWAVERVDDPEDWEQIQSVIARVQTSTDAPDPSEPGKRRVKVNAIMRDEIDYENLAKAFLQQAEIMNQEKDRSKDEPDSR